MLFYISKENLNIIKDNNDYIKLNNMKMCFDNSFYNLISDNKTINEYETKNIDNLLKLSFEDIY